MQLWWKCCHGGRSMRRWVMVLLGVTVLGASLQLMLFLTHKTHAWLSSVAPNATRNATHAVLYNSTIVRVAEKGDGRIGGPHDHHPYRFLLNQPHVCNNHTELVIVVITALKNSQDRQAVRDSWGSYRDDPHHNVSLVFLAGAGSDLRQQEELVKETRRHQDIVQEDFVDSYRNLSLKSVALLKWVTVFCNSTKYVMKADDDMYVNVENLLKALRTESLSHSKFVMGNVQVGAKPVQNKKSKWYTPKEQFNEAVYPRYASGTAYAMTISAARELYTASALVPLFWLEDIYITGLCARKAGVPVYHHWAFSYVREKVDGCLFRKKISGHRYTAKEKHIIFQQVNDPSLKCR